MKPTPGALSNTWRLWGHAQWSFFFGGGPYEGRRSYLFITSAKYVCNRRKRLKARLKTLGDSAQIRSNLLTRSVTQVMGLVKKCPLIIRALFFLGVL